MPDNCEKYLGDGIPTVRETTRRKIVHTVIRVDGKARILIKEHVQVTGIKSGITGRQMHQIYGKRTKKIECTLFVLPG